MRYLYKNKKEINSKKEWKEAFCSAYSGKSDDYHWKEGRSGERLAEDFKGENAQGENNMVNMVKLFLNTDDVVLEIAKIEHPSVFDSYPRPRMQDLAIWGSANGKKIFIGIEAKVDESFGSKSISQQRKYVSNLKTPTEADKRLDGLIRDFLNGEEDVNGELPYQLLYYLAGSFREPNVDIIFMPVIVYKSNSYSEEKGNKNHDAYLSFMEALKFDKKHSFEGDEIQDAYYKRLTVNGISKDVYSCYIVK